VTTVNITIHRQPTPAVPPQNIPLLSFADYTRWQNGILASSPNAYRLRKWGDPVLVYEAGRSVELAGTSNFQAIGLWNKETGFGGVTNHVWISRGDIDRVAAMQVEDNYVAKVTDWRDQKMRWLFKPKGTIYFYGDLDGGWRGVPKAKWGTIGLGWNLVTVEGVETLTVIINQVMQQREMARLATYRKADQGRSLEDLLAHGLVHRCFCAYSGDDIGDSPKGICYSPFWSPLDWDFAGNDQPSAFYLPLNWLSKA